MKTLLFTTQYPPQIGGVPTYYYYCCKQFAKDDIVVFTAEYKDAEFVDRNISYPVYRSKFLKGYKTRYSLSFAMISIAIFVQLVRIVLKENIRHIIVGQTDIALLLMCSMLKKILRRDFIIFFLGDGDSPRLKLKSDSLKQFCYNRAKGFIVCSKFAKQRLQEKFRVSSGKVHVLYPGVDTKAFFPAPENGLRNKLNLSNKRILLTVGRLDKRKGHDKVIEALPKIAREIPDITYVIVGSGDQEAALRILARQLNVEDKIRFIGSVPDEKLIEFYNLCDVFIMANRELEDGDTEGFGMVFVEANACAKPVIGGHCGGATEAIEDGVTGLLVDPYNVDDIAEKIVYLMKNKSAAKSLGKNGLNRVNKRFDWESGVKPKMYEFIKKH